MNMRYLRADVRRCARIMPDVLEAKRLASELERAEREADREAENLRRLKDATTVPTPHVLLSPPPRKEVIVCPITVKCDCKKDS